MAVGGACLVAGLVVLSKFQAWPRSATFGVSDVIRRKYILVTARWRMQYFRLDAAVDR